MVDHGPRLVADIGGDFAHRPIDLDQAGDIGRRILDRVDPVLVDQEDRELPERAAIVGDREAMPEPALAVMGAALVAVGFALPRGHGTGGMLVTLVAKIVVGAGVYVLVARSMRMPELPWALGRRAPGDPPAGN